jgi:plastocyanin
LYGVGELSGIRVEIGDVVEQDAQERVEVGQEIDWVLGKVGKPVVFVGVDVRREQIGRRGTIESDAQAGHRWVRAHGDIEAFQ